MKSIGNILQNAYERSVLVRGAMENKAVKVANEFLLNEWGTNISNQAQAIYIRNGILTIACLNSFLTEEIKQKENKLKITINHLCPNEVMVKKIRYLD